MKVSASKRKLARGFMAKEVHAYLEAKVRGRKARRPKVVGWRR